jgi:hypothetical protein
MMRAACTLAAAICLATSVPVSAQRPIARPDTERTQPELGRLRDHLLAAIRERRVDAVRALMKPTIVDQDADVPAEDVLASMGPLTVGQPLSDEWRAFEQALGLGGVFRDGRYVLPFIEPHVHGWPSREEHLFVAGRDVAVRHEPRLASPVMTRLTYALVVDAVLSPERPGDPASACAAWSAILLPDRQRGWICSPYVRHVSGLYYAFERVDGAWKLARVYSITQ